VTCAQNARRSVLFI